MYTDGEKRDICDCKKKKEKKKNTSWKKIGEGG